jgi:hypothetical protein
MRQTITATGGARAPQSEASIRTKAGGAPRPPCILGCVNKKTLEPRPRQKNDALCTVCAHRIEVQVRRGEAWLSAHLSQYGSWVGGIQKALGAPKKQPTKRGKH